MIPLLSYPIILPICSTLFPAYDSNFKSPNSFEGLQSPTRITMARRPKRTRLYLNNHISRSQALAYLAQNEINQATVPAVQVEDSQSEVADVHHEQDEGDSVGKMLFEDDSDSSAGSTASIRDSVGEESFQDGRFPGEDLPAGDSYSPEQQLHVMLGGDFVVEDDKSSQDEAVDSLDEDSCFEDLIELDTQEQAMLDLLQLCQDAGTHPTIIIMARRPKRTRLYLNNQISRSQALAHLAQNEITQQTVPGVEVLDYPQSEAEDVFQEHDEGCRGYMSK